MGKRARAAADAAGVEAAEAAQLSSRLVRWRAKHPRRVVAGVELFRASETQGLPKEISEQRSGGVYTRAAGAASGASSAASGAPAPWAVYGEAVIVPFVHLYDAWAGTGKDRATSRVLHTFTDPDTGATSKHTTSIERMAGLAKTHPLVATMIPCRMRHLLGDRVLDSEGRASSGSQSLYDLSLSLSVSGKVLRMGLSCRGVGPTSFLLWWKPMGRGWTEVETQAARRTFFDLAELTAEHLFPGEEEQMLQIQPQPSSASPGAASGAPGAARQDSRHVGAGGRPRGMWNQRAD